MARPSKRSEQPHYCRVHLLVSQLRIRSLHDTVKNGSAATTCTCFDILMAVSRWRTGSRPIPQCVSAVPSSRKCCRLLLLPELRRLQLPTFRLLYHDKPTAWPCVESKQPEAQTVQETDIAKLVDDCQPEFCGSSNRKKEPVTRT
jgi:hypothetical protein